MKANDVCQLKYVEDSQTLSNDEMGTGAQRFHSILPVSEQNFEEQAWWTNELILRANLKVGDVCQLKYTEGTQVLTTDEVEVGSQRSCLILPVFEQNFEERAWWTNGLILHANLKVGGVCQLKYDEGSQVLTTAEMEVGSQRSCLILPVSEQNFEEQARVD